MRKATELRLKRISGELLHFLGIKNSEVQIFLLPNKEMLKVARRAGSLEHIHKTKIGKKISTEARVNVLSFPGDKNFPTEDGRRSIGEVFINYDWSEGKVEVLTYLLIHGILHLAGYQHEKKRDIIEMEKLEKKLWRHVLLSV